MKINNHNILLLVAMTSVSFATTVSAHGGGDTRDLTVTYSPADALDDDFVTQGGELLVDVKPNREIARLHEASGYNTIPTQRHFVPPYYHLPTMEFVNDFVITEDEMVTINPAPGEYVRIMEGKRHGFNRTTVGITVTQQGGGAPLHTHESEESHVLVEGDKVKYQLGDEVFVVEAPYIINIPPMVPHAFMNLREKPIELVVFFPVNNWEADFVEHDNAQEFFTLPENSRNHKNWNNNYFNKDNESGYYKKVKDFMHNR